MEPAWRISSNTTTACGRIIISQIHVDVTRLIMLIYSILESTCVCTMDPLDRSIHHLALERKCAGKG